MLARLIHACRRGAALPFVFTVAVPAQVVLRDPAGADLIALDAKVEVLASDLKFSEGPVWLAGEQRLLFSDIPEGKLRQWTEAKGVQDFVATEEGNGNTLDCEGRVVTCQHRARNVVRREADGTVRVLAERCDGKLFHSPNDVAVRNDGTIWFTDPTYGLGKRPREQERCNVYRLDPANGVVTVVQSEFDQPNGICFSPDHDRVYIASSGKQQRIGAFPITKDGTLGKAEFWIEGGADGLRCDRAGNLWAAAGVSGVVAFSPTGKPLLEIECGEVPTNLAFGGVDGKTLFITARRLLLRIPVRIAGAAIPPEPAKPPTDAAGK
jgi:gluconolactonase